MTMTTLAQVAVDNPLATFGLAGLVIGWMMIFIDKLRSELRTLSHRIDGMTRALLIDLISRDSIGPLAKQMAREELAKIEARSAANK